MDLARQLRPLLPAALAFAASAALLIGCGGKAIGTDLTSSGDPPGGGDAGGGSDDGGGPTTCEGPNIACRPGDTILPSQAACPSDGSCYSVAIPCGTNVLWCAPTKGPQCGAIPRCDPGDTQVAACPPPTPGPPDAGSPSCYLRTVCGSTIACQAACEPGPQCFPGDVEVSDPGTCAKANVKCYGVTACGLTIRCYTP